MKMRVWITDGSWPVFSDTTRLRAKHAALFSLRTRYEGVVDPAVPRGRATIRAERPDDALYLEAEWVVEFRALGQKWRSRSTVEELDAAHRRFVYRSRTDDGNPSYGRWTWEVAVDPAGSRVTVTSELHPVTFWRRVHLGRIRARQLARTELPASLAALASATGGTAG